MELTIWRLFDGLNSYGSRINNVFDQTRGRFPSSQISAMSIWSPPVDVLESKDSHLVRAELPGMNKQDFNLEVRWNVDPQWRAQARRAAQWLRIPQC